MLCRVSNCFGVWLAGLLEDSSQLFTCLKETVSVKTWYMKVEYKYPRILCFYLKVIVCVCFFFFILRIIVCCSHLNEP